MKRILYRLLGGMIIFSSLAQCSGSRASIRLEDAKVPVSMSAYLFGRDGHVVAKGHGISVLGKFEYEKRFWGVLWTLANISDDRDVSEAINDQVKLKGGEGLINFTVESDSCAINGIPFLDILPIWPGCTKAKFTADIVKSDRGGQP